MERNIIMGVDGGTGGMRVGLYDFKGHELAFASTEYPTEFKYPGWAEQKPQDWWDCLVTSTKEAMKKAGVVKEQILAMSIDTTSCSVLLCKEDGTPIRDCLIWMDVRSAKEADIISNCGDEALKYNGYGPTSAEWMPCKLLWLKNNERENYDAAEVFCEYNDWIMQKLVGFWSINCNNASARWYYNADEGGFPRSLYEKIGIPEALDKFPKKMFLMGDKLGTLQKSAAEELGLCEDTIVVQGGVDAFVGLLGMGVARPGKVGLITGSSHLVMTLVEKPKYAKGYFGPYRDAVIKDLYLAEGGQVSSGSIISWFKREFCADLDAKGKPEGKNMYDYLTPIAAELPPGSEGLMVLDYWQGNRNPHADASVRGMFYGLSLNHTRAHMFRAIMEGIAYGTENILDAFRRSGFECSEIMIGGGATNSDLYMQIHADVSNVTINVPREIQTPSLGCAILAAYGAGVYPTIADAVDNMVEIEKVIKPNPEAHEKYKALFAQYKKIYPEFKDWMHATTALSEK